MQPTTSNRWLAFAGLVALALVMFAGAMLLQRPSGLKDAHTLALQPAPAVSLAPKPVLVQHQHRQPPLVAPVVISPSQAEQIYIPAANQKLVIDDPVLAMPTSCQQVIEPPLVGPTRTGVFQCMDFGSLPGTDSPSLTVIAGHASNYKYALTVFDRLDKRADSLVGQQVFLRTAKSGKHWLVYYIQHVYRPLKSQLSYQTKIWGKPGQSTAGRLILVTCIEHPDGSPSTNNLVVVAQFSGIK